MSTAAIAIEAITTVAGTGTEGYNGDNQPAIDADLDYPEGVAVDGSGNLYIAERYNHRVRKVDHATGVITTVAGTGTAGYNGDNQPAVDAELNVPEGVAVDEAGNLYIVDRVNYRVRKVDPAGIITTVAGTGTEGYNGDDRPAIDAYLDYPEGVAVDGAGDLYIADLRNHRVRKVDHGTGVITTVAGTGNAGYNGDNQLAIDAELHYPNGVAVDGAGNLYIADSGNQRVRRVDPAGGITTVAGTGTEGYNGDNQAAINADLDYPEGVAVDGADARPEDAQPLHFRHRQPSGAECGGCRFLGCSGCPGSGGDDGGGDHATRVHGVGEHHGYRRSDHHPRFPVRRRSGAERCRPLRLPGRWYRHSAAGHGRRGRVGERYRAGDHCLDGMLLRRRRVGPGLHRGGLRGCPRGRHLDRRHHRADPLSRGRACLHGRSGCPGSGGDDGGGDHAAEVHGVGELHGSCR
ncbi:NHL repeat-containing protein [Nocardia sp. NPDC003726]